MIRFQVVWSEEIWATSPVHAARIARDMMLNPDVILYADVHPVEYCEEADDWFPVMVRGWQARFEFPGTIDVDLIEWSRVDVRPGEGADAALSFGA